MPAFDVVGLPLRTTNAAKLNPATAQIKKHWERFFAEGHYERIPKASNAQLGMYTGFERYPNERTVEIRIVVRKKN